LRGCQLVAKVLKKERKARCPCHLKTLALGKMLSSSWPMFIIGKLFVNYYWYHPGQCLLLVNINRINGLWQPSVRANLPANLLLHPLMPALPLVLQV